MIGTMFNTLLAAAAKVEIPIDGQTGVWIKSGTTIISSAMTMTGVVVLAGQSQYIYNSGKALNTVISSGGIVAASNGGLVSNCSLYSSARLLAYSGATVSGMHSYQTGAVTFIYPGASAFDVEMTSGQINNSGYASGVIMNGICYVQGNGTYEHVVQHIGYAYPNGSANDWIKSGGNISMYAGTPRLTNLTQHGGNCHVRIAGAVVSGVIISGGTLYISSGCTALAVSSAGGAVDVLDGGYIEYVNQ